MRLGSLVAAAMALLAACGSTGTSQSPPGTASAPSPDAPSRSPSRTPGEATLFTREGVTTCLRAADLPVETESGIIAAGVEGIAVWMAGGAGTAEAVIFVFASKEEAEAAGLSTPFEGEVRTNAFVLWGDPTEEVRSAVDVCVPVAPRSDPGPMPAASPTRAPATRGAGPYAPPEATPLAQPPAAPAGDGTTATISTAGGDIVVELFNQSSPVAAENFANLAEAGYYDGVIFHRVIPGFVIQGGDPTGTGRGGPGYSIRDDPVVGEYERGILAMARPADPATGEPIPDSAGSQFFIILADLRERLPKEGRYQIFGRVTSGMEVADAIAAGATGANDRPLEPVAMTRVVIDRP